MISVPLSSLSFQKNFTLLCSSFARRCPRAPRFCLRRLYSLLIVISLKHGSSVVSSIHVLLSWLDNRASVLTSHTRWRNIDPSTQSSDTVRISSSIVPSSVSASRTCNLFSNRTVGCSNPCSIFDSRFDFCYLSP